ncbi:DUF72 domain-containing protein [Rhodococcus sp. NPDC003318]|uniref:DUF72 domain-containing protein n=1 Tax=Rhodococcus sp. NPDC003318 TaxID=3364503 RepID=UPI0036A74002
MARIRVGISGWTYPNWRGDFYPKGLVHRRELAYAAERMTSIEINGSFYSLGRPTAYVRWRDETPDDFVFAVKGSRYITHVKRLGDVETALANFLASGVLVLEAKLGPFLWQLPATLTFDADRFDAFLAALPRSTTALAEAATRHDAKVPQAYTDADARRPVRHAVEVRHPSFATPEALRLAERRTVAVVVADTAGRFPVIDTPTTDFMYVRLHGHTELYTSGYASRTLDMWARRVGGWAEDGLDSYVYFDNDARGRAPFDALALLRRLD